MIYLFTAEAHKAQEQMCRLNSIEGQSILCPELKKLVFHKSVNESCIKSLYLLLLLHKNVLHYIVLLRRTRVKK